MKILTVFNTCGLSGKENTSYYVDAIRSLFAQTHYAENPQSRLVVSGCALSHATRGALIGTFRDYISYNFIPGAYPLGVTFNDTVDQMISKFGEFDAYLYVDSGVSVWGQWGMLSYLERVHREGPFAITAVMTSNDTGFEWWGIPYEPTPYTLPIGKAFNMHFQLFDESWRKAYGRILPDIFASDTSESVFTFMAAAIGKKVQIRREQSVLHCHSMDGASSGFRGRILFPGFPGQKDIPQIYEEGKALGLGYEECREGKPWAHDPSCYDEQGNAKTPEALREFIARELFLPQSTFDYRTITREFIAGK